MTRSDVGKGHPEYYQDKAEALSQGMDNAFYVNQFNNPANPRAHEETTGPEIWAQMEHDLDAMVCGVGSGGTITGLSRFFGQVAPALEMVLADPEGSVLAGYIATGEVSDEVGSWLVEGIGEDFLPPICDFSRVRRAYTIPDREAFAVCRKVLLNEGVIAGTSSGTLIAAAVRYCREQTEPKRVVTFVCDSGNKYLSKVYNDFWMIDQGFIQRRTFGDLRDLIARRHQDHATYTLSSDDTVLTAYSRMKLYDVSQLPVLKGNKIVGIVDEEDILLEVFGNEDRFQERVDVMMTQELETVPPTAPLEALLPIFDRGMVAIVEDNDTFLGIITRIDLLNFLRRRMK
jgi:cystathionine beta-synthase